ncbi:MAG: hypothetical protein JWO09_2011 [Bacteroidetes bacterium]|nr:hypothetical protein [Bacteroidota bacterium]
MLPVFLFIKIFLCFKNTPLTPLERGIDTANLYILVLNCIIFKTVIII